MNAALHVTTQHGHKDEQLSLAVCNPPLLSWKVITDKQGAVPVAGPADEGDVARLPPVRRLHGLKRERACAQDDDVLPAPSLVTS